MSHQYSLSELKRKRTLSSAQADDLKIDSGSKRVWLARTTTADGEPFNNKVTVEELKDGRWITVDTYPALETLGCCGKNRGKLLRAREPGANMATPYVSMTYGTVPSLKAFEQRLKGAVDEDGALLVSPTPPVFYMELVEHTEIDAVLDIVEKKLPKSMAGQIKIGPGSGQKWKTRVEIQSIAALHALIEKLTAMWNSKSVYATGAGDLASVIMQTLHYEWI